MIDKFLIFDIYGDYAHFKKYYTTSSPLTFSIPPRTAITGLISAIIGMGKEEYLSVMTKDKAEIAVRIINPIKKTRMTQNLINTKDVFWTLVRKPGHEPRTQICFEYLKNPKFRIYFRCSDDKIYNSLKDNLKNHKSVYTPYLGISELIADFIFIDEVSIAERLNGKEFIEIHTVIPFDTIVEFDWTQTGKKFFKDRIPTEMIGNRVVTEYREVLYEFDGKPLKARVKGAIKLSNNDIIILL